MSVTKPKFEALKKALKAAGISFKPVKSEFEPVFNVPCECAVRVDVRTPRTEQLAIAAWITVLTKCQRRFK
jgi:hypothetical protein